MTPWRKCIFGCKKVSTLHAMPRDETQRQKWLAFIYGPEHNVNRVQVFVCDRHFSEDSFQNYGLYKSGLTLKLILLSGAVPSIKDPASAEDKPEEKPSVSAFEFSRRFDQSKLKTLQMQPMSPAEVAALPPSLSSFPIMLIPGKTEPKKETKTVGTQLSANTMKNHVRSKAVQVRPKTNHRTADVSVQTSPLEKEFLSEPEVQPKKRPRLEMEEKVEEEAAPVFNDRSVFDFSEPPDTDSTPDHEDTKYIVFEKSLRELFERCPVCRSECSVQRRRRGTLVSFTQRCPECEFSRSWQNQPVSRSAPVGDLQLSAAVYFCGASFQKMHRICKGINLQIHQLDTFKKHCRMFLEPAICHNWKLHQETVFDKLREQRELPVAGEMRDRPPRPGAKRGSYTTMDLESKKILDVQLVQSKEKGNKSVLEKRGLKRSLERLEASGLKVDYVVTDRRSRVHKYLQNRQIPHYYDVWRLEKDLSKRLDELAKKKDFLVVKKWSAALKHHMYWAAASSKTGAEKVAKWISQINHIQDVHKHDDPLFPQCAHPKKKTTDPNKWFKPGSKALDEVEKLLLNKRVLRDVPKLCSEHQASALHVFHNLSLQFAPDDVPCSFMETKCRLFLAAMHFNENTALDQETCGNSFLFPRSEQACPSVKTKTTFGYVRDLMKLLFTEVLNDPSSFVEDLRSKRWTRIQKNHKTTEKQL